MAVDSIDVQLPSGKSYKQPIGLFVNNEYILPKAGKKFETINPSTGKPICEVYEAKEEDVDVAVEAAVKAFKFGSEYRSLTSQARGKLLTKLADLMERDVEVLATIESLDNGKSISMARMDVQLSANCIRYYGGWCDKIHGKTMEVENSRFMYTRHEPVGVCGQIIPWNFPLLMWSWKIGPAIACGNVVVLKTAEQTPLSALKACELVKEAGFPAGVINVLSGFGKIAGDALARHDKVDKVAFTGSTVVGRAIMKASAESNLKKVTLELGGKSPNIIFNDADIDQAVKWSNFGIYYNHGQCCCAGSRIYVQEGIYDKFVQKFIETAKATVVGDPFKEDTFQGPQVSQLQFDRIMGYIRAGRDEGAKIEIGGERHGEEGYFIQPTVITNVNQKMKIMQEEIFGPVVAIAKFTDIEDVIEKAHDTTYGLAAAVFTTNLKTAIQVSNRLEAGTVWVNSYNTIHHQLPFGGFKQSGIGRELGKYALHEYTHVKGVHLNLEMPAPIY
ncbi:putative aldehyde dehydrogenase-like protein C9E9.09c [Saitoella complicata NRRL Y-17804]|uniref:putative aldehyde dehydrogenase-like protein C9E9.09c n=1 Tax=Saitoella complicata (strain BCRC 22490 / CBS 7301 / JCM 7358 / NBRC 10748 / NRRL Y-17804) TaxID=698492 RepID=UPI00086782E5|nr:putative aldehyde dehydrogenase-like protein C9E9.09c [Saitoella complicata NRRL Y-17804]ODQ52036.1 putative aldehyde dehydrogenase-like protein C9E9.09c [Saitoella complicata NRRL Y-17804]